MIKRLLIKLLGLKPEVRYIPMRAQAPWTNEHAKQLSQVLNSEFGRILLEHMNGWQAEASAKIADNDNNTTDYKRGTVFGFNRFIQLLNQYANYSEIPVSFEDVTDDHVMETIRNRIDRTASHDKFVL